MKCHDIQLMITGFIEKRLTDQQLETFIDHIAHCRDCYDELEVYYMITTGLMQLDENHTGTLDLKKNLRDFIEEQRRGLCARKRASARKKRLIVTGIMLLLCGMIFFGYVFLTTEEGIHTPEEFRIAAVGTIQKYWFGQEAFSEPEPETKDPVERRIEFELNHPLIPSYFSNLKPPEPEHRNILEKER